MPCSSLAKGRRRKKTSSKKVSLLFQCLLVAAVAESTQGESKSILNACTVLPCAQLVSTLDIH